MKSNWKVLLVVMFFALLAVSLVACGPAAPAVDTAVQEAAAEAQAKLAEMEAQLAEAEAAAETAKSASAEELTAAQAELEAAKAAAAEAEAAAAECAVLRRERTRDEHVARRIERRAAGLVGQVAAVVHTPLVRSVGVEVRDVHVATTGTGQSGPAEVHRVVHVSRQ